MLITQSNMLQRELFGVLFSITLEKNTMRKQYLKQLSSKFWYKSAHLWFIIPVHFRKNLLQFPNTEIDMSRIDFNSATISSGMPYCYRGSQKGVYLQKQNEFEQKIKINIVENLILYRSHFTIQSKFALVFEILLKFVIPA